MDHAKAESNQSPPGVFSVLHLNPVGICGSQLIVRFAFYQQVMTAKVAQ